MRATTLTRQPYMRLWGYAGQQVRERLQSMMNRLICKWYLPCNDPTIEQLCHLFSGNPGNVLHRLLHPAKPRVYCLIWQGFTASWQRMINTFIARMLYTYWLNGPLFVIYFRWIIMFAILSTRELFGSWFHKEHTHLLNQHHTKNIIAKHNLGFRSISCV